MSNTLTVEALRFPFGEPLHPVCQADRTPKKVFVLGVYASAVHARWLDVNGKQLVGALAVASEPSIFWTGEGADDIISRICIPPEAGTLTKPVMPGLNGPSGRVLDECFLHPLGISRQDAWLCDLLPESRVNPQQRKAIDRAYMPLCQSMGLPLPTVPDFAEDELGTETRTQAILAEIKESRADTLVLLGDLPIRFYLKKAGLTRLSRLSEFGDSAETYGKPWPMSIVGRTIAVIPLCHPRQAGKLGQSSTKWGELHQYWIKHN